MAKRCVREPRVHFTRRTPTHICAGDGARWGDVTGTGFDDYIWISAFGEITIFPNKARANSFDWYKSVAWGSTTLIKTGVTRRALHIADWNGDGKADIIAVDRVSGELTVWLSTSEPGKVSFQDPKKYSDTKGFCTLGWGVLYYDTSHHFADIKYDSVHGSTISPSLQGKY